MTATATETSIRANAEIKKQRSEDNEQLQLVTFVVDQEEFAVDILVVQEINRMMQITQVPQSPDCVEGIINLRGRIITVVDLRKRFGMATKAHGNDSRIIVVEVEGHVLGFIVDGVKEVLRIDSSIVDPAPTMTTSIDSDYIDGVGKLDDRLLILLNLSRLFDAEQLKQMTRMADNAA